MTPSADRHMPEYGRLETMRGVSISIDIGKLNSDYVGEKGYSFENREINSRDVDLIIMNSWEIHYRFGFRMLTLG